MSIVRIIFFITLFFNFNAYSDNSKCSLSEERVTQTELNQHADQDLKKVESELDAVIKKIKKIYSGKIKFLTNLNKSQKNWETQVILDLDLKFPETNKLMYYGSIFPMCYTMYKTELIRKRITFLKEWLRVANYTEVCSGSVQHE